tara:strand:- start:241 stop:1215 length:975 start_codon:yes stop_codon:yes gene_type:complete
MTQGMLTPTTFEGAMQFSETMAQSSMVPKAFQGKPADILVAVQWGSEVGLPPLAALQNIAVINGKPSIYGDSLLALVTGHPEYGGHEETIARPDGDIIATCRIVRLVKGREVATERSFSQGDAQRAKLWNKPGPWTQYPKRMLQMRARSFAIRDAFPDAIAGISVAEEQTDVSMKDVTPSNPLDAIAPTVEEKLPAVKAHTESIEVPDDAEVPNTIDVTPEASEGHTEDIAEIAINMTLSDGEVLYINGWGEFYSQFLTEINAISDDGERTYKERRHDISEYKKLNDEMLEIMEKDDAERHKLTGDAYKKLIKYLSAKAKEVGE